jgi:hypothetical protein
MSDWGSEVLELIRVVLAGLFLLVVGLGGGMFIVVSAFQWNPWLLVLAVPLAVAWGIGSLLGAFFFNWDPFEQKRWAAEAAKYNEEVRQAKEQGLIVSTDFRARRLFEVDSVEPDMGPIYFLELESGLVLFLNGQYMWDYLGGPDEDEARRFPCTEFTVRRHKLKGYVIDMDCRGTPLEPEVETPPFDATFYDDQPWRDGDILAGIGYDELKEKLFDDSQLLSDWLEERQNR